jgi:hypothetical protein
VTMPVNDVSRVNPRDIPDTLKEAVADGLLNTLVDRLSGSGEHSEVIFGTRPRNALSSGFLLPQGEDADGDEVSASIRISSHGLDFLVTRAATATIRVQPHAVLYVRVFPTEEEIRNHPNCDPKFTLRREIELQRRAMMRERVRDALKTLDRGRRNAKWPATELEIRRAVHRELGIPFEVDEVEETTGELSEIASDTDTGADEELNEGPRFSSRTHLPDHLANDAAVPQKWRRLTVDLPALEFRLDNIAAAVAVADEALRSAIDERLSAWASDDDSKIGGSVWGYRRGRKIRPSDIDKWAQYLLELRTSGRRVVTPTISLHWAVETTPDFLDPACLAIHVALENNSEDAASLETDTSVFQVRLDVTVDAAIHRSLMLDRVKPSYRYYQYLAYPALGFNGGVEARRDGTRLLMKTTWTPRFCQPRIVPRSLPDIVTNIAFLSSPQSLEGLRPLLSAYEQWLEQIRFLPIASGIDSSNDTDLVERERVKFAQDLENWSGELDAIRTGIAILEKSRRAWSTPGPQVDPVAAPFEAWCAMNAAMAQVAKAKGYEDWRLFQLAFILATLPALVTRVPAFHEFYTPETSRAANSVTLLYFATGGGKSEAFFGLLVFSLFLDRLRGKERGVTALIRYPLRLLTLQQAKRAATALAHAELIRRSRRHPGEPFSIGFWVGSGNTPNSLMEDEVRTLPDVAQHPQSAEAALLNETPYIRALEKWNKLTRCPFCSGPTGLRRFPDTGGALGHLCLADDCAWGTHFPGPTPLPFYIVDDDIYDLAPTVLLGTVDKLALLGQSQRTIRRFLGMFGLAPGYKPATGRLYLPDHRALVELSLPAERRPFSALYPAYADGEKRYFDPFPALLIQDEAHLLDESLGTFAGLFETAMDAALDELGPLLGDEIALEPGTGRRRRIKVIAASATVTDPERQMRSIYQRANTIQFPYPGPDLYSSFYAAPKKRCEAELREMGERAQDAEQSSQWARLYQSILTNGHTHTVTVVETLAHFHATITDFFEAFMSGDSARVADARFRLSAALSSSVLKPTMGKLIEDASPATLTTLLDLHRISLTYVTNKKGGDQIMAAESVEFDKKHRALGFEDYRLQTDLITGAMDAGHIQAVIAQAEDRASVGSAFRPLNDCLRSIVATSAVSHGVDVEELNSMFFAGMPSDIAEYIQASSRIGRTHVGFCILVPTPQRARDRYIVEVHDIFHRFLERMIGPAAIDRWAEKAVERVIASFLQTFLCGVRSIKNLNQAPNDDKGRERIYRLTQEAKDAEREDALALKRDIAQFIESAVGLRSPYAPQDIEHYQGLIRTRVNDIFNDMTMTRFSGSELRKFLALRSAELRPMLSLRDVDKPGRIVAASWGARDDRRAKADQIRRTMRFIRQGSGAAIDDDEDLEE